jgi:hypothetical protein
VSNESKISHWAYRAARQTIDGEVEWSVREVYFDTEDVALGWTLDAIAPTGDTREELAETLRRMILGLEHDALDLDAPN